MTTSGTMTKAMTKIDDELERIGEHPFEVVFLTSAFNCDGEKS